MNKILIIACLMSFSVFAQAQVNPHALGLRLGGNNEIGGAEISYQHGVSEDNRVELDFGFQGSSKQNRLFLVGIYHWVWNIDGGFNWFVGPGGAVGFYSYKESDDYINISLGGQIGIEYDFNVKDAPILLSLDTRPMWDFLGDQSGFGWGVALGVRYTW